MYYHLRGGPLLLSLLGRLLRRFGPGRAHRRAQSAIRRPSVALSAGCCPCFCEFFTSSPSAPRWISRLSRISAHPQRVGNPPTCQPRADLRRVALLALRRNRAISSTDLRAIPRAQSRIAGASTQSAPQPTATRPTAAGYGGKGGCRRGGGAEQSNGAPRVCVRRGWGWGLGVVFVPRGLERPRIARSGLDGR